MLDDSHDLLKTIHLRLNYFISGATPKKTLGMHTQYNGALGLEMSPICNGKDSLDLSLLQKVFFHIYNIWDPAA